MFFRSHTNNQFNFIIQTLNKMALDLTVLTQSINDNKSKVETLINVSNKIVGELQAIRNSTNDPAVQSQLDALSATLTSVSGEAQKQSDAEALVDAAAGTPVTPVTPTTTDTGATPATPASGK